jgi:GNAT superfamily N-acetyltransferase
MGAIEIRPATAAEFATAVEWAAAEGWNPGLDDLGVFHRTDPSGFIMGFEGGEPVSSISVVRYPGGFGFLGFYIVRPDRRGTGIGMATWNAGMAHLSGCAVGLDGVVAQQENYRKNGFVLAGRNIRHWGVPKRIDAAAEGVDPRPVRTSDLDALADFDAAHFPVRRDAFIRDRVLPADRSRRHAVLAMAEGSITGFGVIRPCRSGFKIGPLFAADAATARAIAASLIAGMPHDAEVALDTPQDNPAAMALAAELGLAPVFETARMYRGEAPHLPVRQIYGITSFELG